MSFKDLKKQSKLGSLTAKLVKEVEKMNNTGGNTDDRIWKLDVDKSGNGYAVIRFLPCLLYTSPSPRDRQKSRMPSSA